MSSKIFQKSIKNRFQVELAMKCAPRRPQDVSRRPQDGPKTAFRSPKIPSTTPRWRQDAPKTPPGPSRTPQDAPQERIISSSISGPPPNLDFGASWGRFWEVLASILGGVSGGFKELKSHKIFKKLGGFGINFEKCFGWFQRAETQTRKIPKTHKSHKTHKTNKTHRTHKTHKTHKLQNTQNAQNTQNTQNT